MLGVAVRDVHRKRRIHGIPRTSHDLSFAGRLFVEVPLHIPATERLSVGEIVM
jgi:hypothetical protein